MHNSGGVFFDKVHQNGAAFTAKENEVSDMQKTAWKKQRDDRNKMTIHANKSTVFFSRLPRIFSGFDIFLHNVYKIAENDTFPI